MTIDEIKDILESINFQKKYITDQTAACILALSDKTERKGLLPGHNNLSEGARIHDILNFTRDVIGKKVAENTRESYRKTSLAHLMDFGISIRHQLKSLIRHRNHIKLQISENAYFSTITFLYSKPTCC